MHQETDSLHEVMSENDEERSKSKEILNTKSEENGRTESKENQMTVK